MHSQVNQTSTDFFTISREIAKKFLQSVVVVDDQATFNETEFEELPQTGLVAPTTRGARRENETLVEPKDQVTSESSQTLSSEPTSEALNVKRLNDCFANSGLVCGVLKPTKEEVKSIANKADHVARRADIVVFDWKLSPEEIAGASALNSIHSILKDDLEKENELGKQSRTRLIAIYTSVLELDKIVDETQSFLNKEGIGFEKLQDDDFVLVKDGAKIVFYRKNRGVTPAPSVQQRTVSENDLVDRLIDDFTKMTYGLLSNIALDSLGALRNNTHRILRKFDRKLDAAYFTHRVMVTPSEEAQQHPVPLLTAEFNDVLEDCSVDEHASISMIEKWLSHQIENFGVSLDRKVFNLSNIELKEALLEAVKNGIESELEFVNLKSDGSKRKKEDPPTWKTVIEEAKRGDRQSFLTNLLTNDNTGSTRDSDFAILTTMRSHYEKPKPMLTLGTIVAKTKDGKENYFICVQPVCDSVRLKKDTVFPFLRLQDTSEPNEDGKMSSKFDIVINDNDEYKKLKTNLKPRDILLVMMKHQSIEEIRAEQTRKGVYIFKTVKNEPDLRWVGSLKFAHAQRIANDFAREISRVGLTESDWLRRMK